LMSPSILVRTTSLVVIGSLRLPLCNGAGPRGIAIGCRERARLTPSAAVRSGTRSLGGADYSPLEALDVGGGGAGSATCESNPARSRL
jgi:hypothetical protein